jgi:hypothetical protein
MIRAVVLVGALLWAAQVQAQRWSRVVFDLSAGYAGYALILDERSPAPQTPYDRAAHRAGVGFRADFGIALTSSVALAVHGSALLFLPYAYPPPVGPTHAFSADPLVVRFVGRRYADGHLIGKIGAGVGFISSLKPNEYLIGFHSFGELVAPLYRELGFAFAADFAAYPTRISTSDVNFFTFAFTVGLHLGFD